MYFYLTKPCYGKIKLLTHGKVIIFIHSREPNWSQSLPVLYILWMVYFYGGYFWLLQLFINFLMRNCAFLYTLGSNFLEVAVCLIKFLVNNNNKLLTRQSLQTSGFIFKYHAVQQPTRSLHTHTAVKLSHQPLKYCCCNSQHNPHIFTLTLKKSISCVTVELVS